MLKRLYFDKIEKRKYDLIIIFLYLFAYAAIVWSVRSVTLGTHDDIYTFVTIKSSSLFNYLKETYTAMLLRGRLSIIQLLFYIPYYLIIKSSSEMLYHIMQYLPILINIFFFSYIISKHYGKYWGLIIPLFFIAFIQLDSNHNLMLSYPLIFQVGLFEFLFAIELFIQYQNKQKKWYLLLSALLLFDSFSTYESFLGYSVIFLLLALYYSINFSSKLRFNFRYFIRQIIYHLIAVALFLIIYFVCRKINTFNYGGALIDTSSFNWKNAIKTLFTFSFSLFPLREFFAGNYVGFALSAISFRMYAKGIALAIGFGMVLFKSEKMKFHNLLFTIIISLVACLIFCIPHSLTPQYQAWVTVGVSGFVPSYFSYYWIVLLLCSLLVFLCNICAKIKLPIILLICSGVFIGSIFTDYSNLTTIHAKQADTVRYKLFDKLVRSNYFGTIENDSAIYVQGYTGIHNQISSLDKYSFIFTKKTHHFTNDYNEVMQYKNRYVLRYDPNSQSVYISRMTDMGIGEEIYVITYKKITTSSVLSFYKSPSEDPVYVNNELCGNYNDTVYISYLPNNYNITVKTRDIILSTFRLTDRRYIKEEQKVEFEFGKEYRVIDDIPFINCVYGWYDKETGGIWSRGNRSSMIILLPSTIYNDVRLDMNMDILNQVNGLSVKISLNGNVLYQNAIMQSGTITFTIPHALIGENDKIINLNIDVANPVSPAELGINSDSRQLGIGLKSIIINMD